MPQSPVTGGTHCTPVLRMGRVQIERRLDNFFARVPRFRVRPAARRNAKLTVAAQDVSI